MNQKELIDAIAAHPGNEGVSKASIKWMLETQAEVAQATLHAGEEVTLPGIGKLHVKYSEARTGRNPASGAEVEIPAKHVPKFTAAKALKDAVNS